MKLIILDFDGTLGDTLMGSRAGATYIIDDFAELLTLL